ncbi:MAG: metallophosphoesterase [Armatimonadetes bacterium]|nr:metallophosphoesterase [Armatimonadota bacterium]
MSSLSRLLLAGALALTLSCPAGARIARKAPATDHFVFVAYGDTRSQPDKHQAVIAEIVRMRPEFVLQSGDLVAVGKDPAQWAEFEAITQPLRDAHIAYYPARGNHDLGPYFIRYVPKPITSGNGYYYAFTRHRSRFLIVDSFEDYSPGSAQYQWLEGELARGQRTAANVFVMFHEGPFSVGPHGPTPEAQRYLHPLFVKYHPRAVFCGHDHLYYRTRRDGVNYIVTGGGGAPLYDPENRQIAIPGDVIDKDYHAVRCTVDGPRVTAVVETPDGRVIDRFTLGPK